MDTAYLWFRAFGLLAAAALLTGRLPAQSEPATAQFSAIQSSAQDTDPFPPELPAEYLFPPGPLAEVLMNFGK